MRTGSSFVSFLFIVCFCTSLPHCVEHFIFHRIFWPRRQWALRTANSSYTLYSACSFRPKRARFSLLYSFWPSKKTLHNPVSLCTLGCTLVFSFTQSRTCLSTVFYFIYRFLLFRRNFINVYTCPSFIPIKFTNLSTTQLPRCTFLSLFFVFILLLLCFSSPGLYTVL